MSLGARLKLAAAVVLGHYGMVWLGNGAAATGNFCRLHVVTESVFAVLTVTGATGTPPTAVAIPAGSVIELPFTAITKTSGIAYAVKAPA